MKSNQMIPLFLFISLIFSSCLQEDKSIKAVVLLDLKGGQSTLGQEAMNGFLLALQQAPLEMSSLLYISLIDTESNQETAKQAAIETTHLVSIGAGFTDNNSVLTVGKYFQNNKTPFLSIGATDPKLPQLFGNQIFLVPFGDNTQAAAAAEFADKKFGKNAVVLWDSTSDYTQNLPLYFKTRFKELDGVITLDRSYPGGCDISNLATAISQLETSPDFIYLAGLPDCIGDVINSLRQAGIQLPIIGGDGLDTPNLTKDSTIDNVWYTTHSWQESNKARVFVKAYQNLYQTAPKNAFAALGYDTANLVLKTLSEAKTTDPNGIYEALESIKNFEGVTGAISYSSHSHVPKKSVWIIEINQGKKKLAKHFIPKGIPSPIDE